MDGLFEDKKEVETTMGMKAATLRELAIKLVPTSKERLDHIDSISPCPTSKSSSVHPCTPSSQPGMLPVAYLYLPSSGSR